MAGESGVQLNNGDIVAEGRITGAKVKVLNALDIEIGSSSTLSSLLDAKVAKPAIDTISESGKFLKKVGNNTMWDTVQSGPSIVTSFPATPLDTDVPSTKLVKDSLDSKFDKTGGTISSGSFSTDTTVTIGMHGDSEEPNGGDGVLNVGGFEVGECEGENGGGTVNLHGSGTLNVGDWGNSKISVGDGIVEIEAYSDGTVTDAGRITVYGDMQSKKLVITHTGVTDETLTERIVRDANVAEQITADVTHAKGASAGGQTASSLDANGILNLSSLFSGANTSNNLDNIRVSANDPTSASTLIGGKITNPSGGSTGNVLKKTASGVEWGEGGGGSAEYDFKNFNVKLSSSVPREQMYVPNPNWVPVVSNKNTNPATATSTGTYTEWDYDPETEEEIEITVNYTETKNVLTGLTSIGLFNFKKDTSVAHRYNLVAERNGAEYDEEEEEYVFTSTTIAHVDYDPENQTWSVTRDATSAKHATEASYEEGCDTEDFSVNNLAFSIADGLITVTGNIRVFPSDYFFWQEEGRSPSTPSDTAFTLTYNIGGREGYDMVVAAKVQLYANAINKIVIPADMTSAQKDFDALVILFPTQTSGKVRDFLIRAEQKWSQAIGFTFPTTETRGGTAGQTITYEGDDFVTMATNKNYLFSFTETTSGIFQTKSAELKAQGAS